MLIPEYFLETCSRRPEHPAIIDRDEVVTWSSLAVRIEAVRRWLRDNGVRRHDRVVLQAPTNVTTVCLVWACLLDGLTVVPVHQDLTPTQVQHVIDDCDPALVCASTDLVEAVTVPNGHAVTPPTGLVHADLDPCPSRADADDLALLIYTSGTTGAPKGIRCPHRQVATAARTVHDCLGYREDDVILCRLPLSFDYGLYQVLMSAIRGGTVVLHGGGPRDRNLVRDIACHGVTVVPVVPSMAAMLLTLQRRDRLETTIRLFTNTGARLSPEVADQLLAAFPGSQYASMYGMTECKRISILPVDEYKDHPDSVGRALPGTRVQIVNDCGVALPAGEHGEITVSGQTVMDGYWNVPNTSTGRFRPTPDGLTLFTGDRGWMDPDGRIHLLGRDDDIVKHHGVRICLQEIEVAAEAIPGVDAVIALKPDSDSAPLEVAYCGTASPEFLAQQFDLVLDRARRPQLIHLLPQIPLTRNGKPDRAAAAAAVHARS
ncbi:acyl--CoA ligase [Cutibacterium sp. WCA-380-WT-3A]|uniref:Acyl--CoA ligase n=1 Tax=Cutibacterium porci TaxID=2605781 RepID=A0A7K0J3V6_9ACTN|nr:class I adenylate-forming enzyme family protein [Cutibacterium porci]MSS44607.1 acyl--CoA ligase [Cutibacterium porci]